MKRQFQAVAGGLFVIALLAVAQDKHPAYEAASVKANNSGTNGSRSSGSKGQIVFTNVTLKRLIERAYGVKPFQVAGPDWMENVRFDIAAKYPPDTQNDDRNLMLRSLLEERFHLGVHRESKLLPGYALVVAKSGFKLKPVEAGGSSTNDEGGLVRVLKVQKGSMELLADVVSRILSVMVVDKTNIEGVYDFELRFVAEDRPPSGAEADTIPTLFVALEQNIGVRLQVQKVPVDVVVVDRLERVPTEN
jgi:uncharacterized protein (TIGR03435 family)